MTSNDPSVLANVFAYHVVPGNFTGVTTRYPNTTVGETLYNDTATVHLEGGRPQALAWAVRSDNLTHVLNQRNDTAIVNVTTFENFTIYIIDHVLDLPQSLEITIPTDNDSLSEFENYLNDASLAFFNTTTNQTSDVTFFEALNTGYKGFTLFAPNNSAIIAANSTLQSLLSNRSAINAILFNHVCCPSHVSEFRIFIYFYFSLSTPRLCTRLSSRGHKTSPRKVARLSRSPSTPRDNTSPRAMSPLSSSSPTSFCPMV